MVGFENNSDAGVYRIGDRQALVQSVDFFTPIIDDAFAFGEIAAANAISDIYALGGKPITALALVCFPDKVLGPEVLVEILQGGATKVHEAGAVIMGGHSVMDPELKYGLAVTGLVDPDAMRTNQNAVAGDVLILTKPLGTGYVANALKAGVILEQDEDVQAAIRCMATLNASASEVLTQHGCRAATDVTGFGLLGHARFMAEASTVGFVIRPNALPFLPGAESLGRAALSGGNKSNFAATSPSVDRDEGLPDARVHLAYDAQTSGGLLACVPADLADAVVRDLQAAGTLAAAVIGEVVADHPGRIRLA